MHNPGRIISRTHLIELAARMAPSRACISAIQEGRISVLGGFKTIPPFGLPGWICRVLSRHGRTWLIAVMVDEVHHTYVVKRIDAVPWTEWAGRTDRSTWNAYDGDDPKRSRSRMWLARMVGVQDRVEDGRGGLVPPRRLEGQ